MPNYKSICSNKVEDSLSLILKSDQLYHKTFDFLKKLLNWYLKVQPGIQGLLLFEKTRKYVFALVIKYYYTGYF